MLSEEAREKRREYYREYYKKNKENVYATQKKWRDKNKDKIKKYNDSYWRKKVNEG